MNDHIPSYELKHDNQKVFFAYRTMEEIYLRTGGKPGIPHRHDYYTVIWAKKACGLHYIDYNKYEIKPNILFFVSPGQVHQVITSPDPEGVVLMFNPEFLHRNYISIEFITNLGLFSDTSDIPPLTIDTQGAQKLLLISDNIEKTFRENSQYMFDSIGAYLKLFLIECNNYAIKSTSRNTQTIQSGRILLQKFKTILEEKHTEWHKVADYSNYLNITPDYLNSVIKEIVGKNAKEFIQQRIVLEAKRLGVHTYLSSKEIAYKLGFEDPSHFSRFFKKVDGTSFSDFRTTIEKG